MTHTEVWWQHDTPETRARLAEQREHRGYTDRDVYLTLRVLNRSGHHNVVGLWQPGRVPGPATLRTRLARVYRDTGPGREPTLSLALAVNIARVHLAPWHPSLIYPALDALGLTSGGWPPSLAQFVEIARSGILPETVIAAGEAGDSLADLHTAVQVLPADMVDGFVRAGVPLAEALTMAASENLPGAAALDVLAALRVRAPAT